VSPLIGVVGVEGGRVRLGRGIAGRWTALDTPCEVKEVDPTWEDLGVHPVPPIDAPGARLHLYLHRGDPGASEPIDAVLEAWAAGGRLLLPPLPRLLEALREGRDLGAPVRDATQLWEVSPHLYRQSFETPTLPPATHTNSYLVGSGQALLVEPAPSSAAEQARMVAWVEESGLDVVALFPTHHHVDHVGAIEALRASLEVPLWGHRATAGRLSHLSFDRYFEDGEVIALDGSTPIELEVLHTPGHAPGHLCLRETRSNAVIAGDMVASVGTILVEPQDGDMTLYLRSLERLRALSPSMLLPAHGLPRLDADAVLERYVTHRLAREAKVLAALEAHEGPAEPRELVPVAYADAPRAVWPLAAMSTEAHLLKLVKDGAVTVQGRRFAVVGH
jgi:ribonuclease/clavin/mitogillin